MYIPMYMYSQMYSQCIPSKGKAFFHIRRGFSLFFWKARHMKKGATYEPLATRYITVLLNGSTVDSKPDNRTIFSFRVRIHLCIACILHYFSHYFIIFFSQTSVRPFPVARSKPNPPTQKQPHTLRHTSSNAWICFVLPRASSPTQQQQYE